MCICMPLARGKESKKRTITVWKRPTASWWNERDFLIAHIPLSSQIICDNVLRIPLCACVCVCVYTTCNPTRSHINYNQIGYWSHTRSQYWSSMCSLVGAHETLSPVWRHRGRESHFSQRLVHDVQITVFTARKVCHKPLKVVHSNPHETPYETQCDSVRKETYLDFQEVLFPEAICTSNTETFAQEVDKEKSLVIYFVICF